VIEIGKKPTKPAEFLELSMGKFLTGKKFEEAGFLNALEQEKWSDYLGKKVAIRAHHIAILPPWAFMMVMAKLYPYCAVIGYGDSHNPIVVYSETKDL